MAGVMCRTWRGQRHEVPSPTAATDAGGATAGSGRVVDRSRRGMPVIARRQQRPVARYDEAAMSSIIPTKVGPVVVVETIMPLLMAAGKGWIGTKVTKGSARTGWAGTMAKITQKDSVRARAERQADGAFAGDTVSRCGQRPHCSKDLLTEPDISDARNRPR